MTRRFDLLVVGAGIMGTSIALAARERGLSVALLDRDLPGAGASENNAGLISPSPNLMFPMPRDPRELLNVLLQRSLAVRAPWHSLLPYAGWLFGYWRASAPDRVRAVNRALCSLAERAAVDHQSWQNAANLPRPRSGGTLDVYLSERQFARQADALAAPNPGAAHCELLTVSALKDLEPGLVGKIAGAVHWPGAFSVIDPGQTVRGLAAYFARKGGEIVRSNAFDVRIDDSGVKLTDAGTDVAAEQVVVALGAWSGRLCRRLGYQPPLRVKRGYSQHFAGSTALQRQIIIKDLGFVLNPDATGVRVTTGAELSRLSSQPTPIQIRQAGHRAEQLVEGFSTKMAGPVWMGLRPCTPDMLPIIGRMPGKRNVWLAFGHNHWGFMLGPTTGHLVAGMICGDRPFADPVPFDPARFV